MSIRLTLLCCFAGSVLSGGGTVPAPQASAQAWASTVTELQKGALSTRLGIPFIYGIDAVHGHNNAYKATIFPHNVGLGATRYWLHLLVICLQYARLINCEASVWYVLLC